MTSVVEGDRVKGKMKRVDVQDEAAEEERVNGTPKHCVPLSSDLHSSASPSGKSSKAVQQKVEDLNLNDHSHHQSEGGAGLEGQRLQQTAVCFYSRRSKTPKHRDALNLQAAATFPTVEVIEVSEDDQSRKEGDGKTKMDMRETTELIEWDVNPRKLLKVGGSRDKSNKTNDLSRRRRRNNLYSGADTLTPHSTVKRWVRLMLCKNDAAKLDGLQCQIYWPMDEKWYMARINGYQEDTDCHHIVYEDGVEEHLVLYKEQVKIFISGEEMQKLSLSSSIIPLDISENDDISHQKFDAAIARFDNLDELGPGDVIWAKLNGHSAWPAVILDEDLFAGCKDLCKKKAGQKSFTVQFFGSHSFSRVNMKQTILFSEGLSSDFYLKCKQPAFIRGLEEVKAYLCEKKLPIKMIQHIKAEDCERRSQDGEGNGYADERCVGNEDMQTNIETSKNLPLQIRDLEVIKLGKITDSEHFRNAKFIWPEGYTAVRKLQSLTDPSVSTTYKMEVMRNNTGTRICPLFRVTLDTGEQFEGSTPSVCWRKVYNSINGTDYSSYHSFSSKGCFRPGSDMFGFSFPEVKKLIKSL